MVMLSARLVYMKGPHIRVQLGLYHGCKMIFQQLLPTALRPQAGAAIFSPAFQGKLQSGDSRGFPWHGSGEQLGPKQAVRKTGCPPLGRSFILYTPSGVHKSHGVEHNLSNHAVVWHHHSHCSEQHLHKAMRVLL